MIRVVTPSNLLPVSLSAALRHLRLLDDEVDVATLYLRAATEAFEEYTGRVLITKTFRLDLDSLNSSNPIELIRSPLVAVDHFKYYAEDAATLSTFDPSNYFVDTTSLPGRICFNEDADLPDVDYRPDAVQIQFQAGYGTSEDSIPAALRAAVLIFAQQLYELRVPVSDKPMTEVPLSLRYLMRQWRIDPSTL